MTLTDRIKGALHKNKSGGSHADTSETGAASGHANEPTTGAGAYQPLTKGAEHGTGSTAGSAQQTGGSGTRSGHTTGAGAAGTHGQQATGASGRGTGTLGRTGSSSSSSSSDDGTGQRRTTGTRGATGDRSAAAGAGGASHFKQGYQEGEPGYSAGYKSGEPLYKESVQRGADGSYSANLEAEQDNKHWAQARELTLAAEREVASAKISGKKASHEMAAAEKAEDAVRKAQIKHREALEEAEKYRAIIGDSNVKEQDLADARSLYDQRRNAAAQAEQELRAAESELSGRKREIDGLAPQLDKYGKHLPSLEEELARRQKARAAAEGDRDKLFAIAQEHENERNSYNGQLEGLERELEGLERTAALKQKEYIEARNAAQGSSQRIAELKSRLRALDNDLLGARNRAQEADQSLPGYKEAEARAARDLENSKGEWYRLKELEEEYSRNYSAAQDRFNSLRGTHDPLSKDLRDSQSLLKAREDDLARARDRSAQAERQYRELLALADRHRKYGDSAAQTAETHGEKYEAAKQDAQIHGDKHVEYWQAAREHGDTGSTESTNLIKKLEQKVRELTHKTEP